MATQSDVCVLRTNILAYLCVIATQSGCADILMYMHFFGSRKLSVYLCAQQYAEGTPQSHT